MADKLWAQSQQGLRQAAAPVLFQALQVACLGLVLQPLTS